jgi:hypothetical protein
MVLVKGEKQKREEREIERAIEIGSASPSVFIYLLTKIIIMYRFTVGNFYTLTSLHCTPKDSLKFYILYDFNSHPIIERHVDDDPKTVNTFTLSLF